MAKREQTYIICLIDADGYTVNFERFSHKRLSTCIAKMVGLYREIGHYSFIREELQNSVRVVAHKTNYETTLDNIVWHISVEEFMEMIA